MADDSVDRGSLKAHVQTYNSVIAMFKWSSIVLAVVVVPLVIWLIAA